MDSETIVDNAYLISGSGNSLKERSLLGHNLAFEKLRRTKSMPKRSQIEKAKVTAPMPESVALPSPQVKTDCFKGFNRAKSKFFHSCRLPKPKATEYEKNETSRWSPLFPSSRHHRPSIVSETGTIASSLSYEREEVNEGSDSPDDIHNASPATYRHPMLEELDAESVVPPPPPRACPAWLKSALQRSQDVSESSQLQTSSSPMDTTSVATSMYSQASSYVGRFDDENYEDVRIYPVMQNGVKISDTHYWIINPPKRRSKLWHHKSECSGHTRVTLRANRDFSTDRLFSGRPTSFSAKLLNDNQHYENVSYSSTCSSPGSNMDVEVTRPTNLRRGRSENSKEFLQTVQRNLVSKLRILVPSATEDECRAVLIGSSWDFEKAQHRLKLELLCRTGFASKSACEKLLKCLNWDLPEALEYVRAENCETLDYCRIPPRICLNTPDLSPACSTGEPVSLTPDISPDSPYPKSLPFP
ncbi:unnamed protein product [Mesocestoides corti]|nr:unnamed protein product [Mesocestoides corti]